MAEQVKDPLSTRTVVISFPDGQSQYWLTDQLFAAGDTIQRNGNAWVVADVLEPARSGGYLKIVLRDLNGSRPA